MKISPLLISALTVGILFSPPAVHAQQSTGGVTIVPEDKVVWGDSAPPPLTTSSGISTGAKSRSVSPPGVPEPTSLSLFALGSILGFRYRRRKQSQ
jgi:PEP-CTERM motif